MSRLIHTDTNLLARFKELTDSLEGCQIAESFQEIERYQKNPILGSIHGLIVANRNMAISMCKEHCPDSFNHIPIHKDIAHVTGSWHGVYAEYEIPYVCQVSGCKVIHINQEPEDLEAINMKTIHNAENSTAVKSESKPVVEETNNKTVKASPKLDKVKDSSIPHTDSKICLI